MINYRRILDFYYRNNFLHLGSDDGGDSGIRVIQIAWRVQDFHFQLYFQLVEMTVIIS